MIGPDDAIVMPPGVHLEADGLHDDVRGVVIPVNRTGAIALTAQTPRRAAAEIARRCAVAEARALRDVVGFCVELNTRHLVNVSRAGMRARISPCAERRAVDTENVGTIVRTGARALSELALVLFVLGAAAAAAAFATFGMGSALLAFVAGASVSLVVVLHELGHLLALVRVPSFVALRRLRVAVVHRRVAPRRSLAVAAAGPLSGVAPAGLALTALAVAPAAEWAVVASTFALNALGLTVLSRDGRTLCGLS